MKYILIFLTILSLTAVACGITINVPDVKTVDTQTVSVDEAAPSQLPAALNIKMGGGKLNIQPGAGADQVVSGEVRYNVEGWKPTVTRDGSSITLEQRIESSIPLGKGLDRVINEWSLKMGGVPTDLTIEAGAYEGTLDLSGVPLTNLKVSDGASKATIVFSSPNPVRMDTFTYETGASSIDLSGLAYANFDVMRFKGGAGNFTLDFSGSLQRDGKVFVDGGLGNITLRVPRGSNTRIAVSGGLNNVTTEGTWTVENNEYRTGGSGPLLRIEVSVGIGNLNLINR